MLGRRHSPPEPKAEFFQIAQYTCLYNADKRAVDCLPFVRTFMQVGRQFTEVTPTVNAGGRLPRGGLLSVPTDVEAAQTVPVKGSPPPGMS
ncbi:hypothetical protein JCM9279_002670 [Rhodotorula babjevae]